MTRIAAFQTLEDRFGREQATALAEFVESQPGADMSRFATKDDIQTVKQDLASLELRLVKEIAKTLEETNREIAKTREDMLSRMNWTAIIQVLTTIGALIALSKII